MGNEIMEESLSGNTTDPVESEETVPVSSPDVLPDETDMENGEETTPDIPENQTGVDAAVLDPEEETGETEEENIYEMENGNEDFYGSVSNNDIMGDGSGSDAPPDYNVTNYYTMEVPAEEVIPLWENSISNFSTSEMLLFLIFLLLLAQFIHKIFKGSHWLKG